MLGRQDITTSPDRGAVASRRRFGGLRNGSTGFGDNSDTATDDVIAISHIPSPVNPQWIGGRTRKT